MDSARLIRSPLAVVSLVLGIGAMTFVAVRLSLAYLRLPGIGSPIWWPPVGAQALIGTVALCALALVLITRHRAELADHVRDSEAALRAALQDALVGMYTIRLDPRGLGVITNANDFLCAMLGYREEDIVGQHCRVIAGWRRPDGSERWVEISATRVTPLLAPPFAMVHVHDLTNREQQRSELEEIALHHQLTGLANRALLFSRID